MAEPTEAARSAVELLAASAGSVAVAESLTGGLVASALVDVPGASAVFRGGVVAYATELKHELLGVDDRLLARNGPVDPDVAVQMAEGVRSRLGTVWGCATTGVAGPGPADGAPAGRVFLAVAGPGVLEVRKLDLTGGRDDVRVAATSAVLELLVRLLRRVVRAGAVPT